MTVYMLIFSASLIVSVGGTPLARGLARRLGFIDQPSERKVHKTPIPRLGGLAIYGAFLLALLLFGQRFRLPQLLGIVIGATVVSFFGLWDDRWGLPPLVKLLGQITATGILIFAGVRVNFLPWPALNLAVTVLWVVGITNAMNLLDNMDGLSGGIGAIAAAFFVLLAAGSGQYLVGSLAAALMGACLGFLLYNFNPASVFMGDTGSLFIGYVLAAVGIKLRFPENVDIVTWMVPVLVLGLPIFDTTLVFFSRLRRGLNPLTTPGRDHTSHRLVALGFTQREAVMALYLVQGALGVLAMYVTEASIIEGYTMGIVVLIAALYAFWRLEQVPFPGRAGASP